MPSEPPGIVQWTVAIRLSMLDDPGRKELQSDIDINGYQWLDEYWENILAGPKNESDNFVLILRPPLNYTFRTLVELVKTPARRKENQKRNKAEASAVARMKTIPDVLEVSFSTLHTTN